MIPRQHAMRNLIARVTNTPWAIDPAKADAICDFLTLRRDGWQLEPHEIAARIGAPRGPTAAVGGAGSQSVPSQIAVLSIQGTIVPRRVDADNVSGGGMVSAESLRQAIDSAAADPQVAQIVLDVNSPGGSVAGIPELAAAVAAASKRKPVWAVANLQMASAAYWISSQATTIVASPSAEVGSIGVLAIHSESSQADRTAGITTTVFRSTPGKADVNSVEPLTDEARTAFQTRIDQVHAQFLQAVADGRRVSLETVAQQFGQGRTMPAQAALAVGMVDRIATLDQLLAELTQPTGSAAPTGASVSGAAAASPAVPRLESVMDPRVLTALIRLGVCTAATSAEAAAVALQTVCALRQIDPNLDPAALAAALVPAATPPTVAAPAGSATPASAPALPVPPAGVGAAQLVSLVQMTAIPPAQQVRLLAELTPQAHTLTLADLTARLNREATAATPPAGPHVAVVGDQVDNLITAGRDALLQRQFAGRNPSTIWDARAQGFVEWRPSRGAAALASLPRLAARILVAHGLPALTVDTLSTQAIARLIFGANPREFGIMADDSALYNSRGSFSNLLYDAANVVLRQAAVEAPTTYQNWMRRGQDLNDFRFVHKVVGGDMANPQAIPENGEFQEATFSDSRESYRLTVWGERFSVTWQTIVDDQLGAFTTVPQKQGRAMARNRNRVAYQTVKDNSALSDGTAFFASGHNNLAGTGAVISVASLNAGEKALREQKGVGDNAFVGVPPRYLLVPPAIAGTAREILSSTANPAASNSGVANIWQNGLEPIVDAELGAAATGGSDTAWYLFTDSADCEHFEYAYLAGMEQPVFEMQPSFERLGLAMRVYQPFACKGIDHRGGYKNPGA